MMTDGVLRMRLTKPIAWVVSACLLALPLTGCAASCQGNREDIFSVSGRVAVFYALSQVEFDSLHPEDQEAYTTLYSDFLEYVGRLGGHLDERSIKYVLTGARFIEFRVGKKPYCFDKTALDLEVGVIFSDGRKQPKVIPGLFTDAEIMPTVTKYYSLR